MGKARTARSEGRTTGSTVNRTVLPSGLRIVTEQIDSVESVCVGVWLDVGSRDETPALAGTSHFLEHLLFKGTQRRNALQIASELDAVGGESNAFTSRENTCFYARVRGKDLPIAVDVLADMITSASITPADVEAERDVVLDEIAMNDDDPGDIAHEDFISAVLGDQPLGRPIIGSVESIESLTRKQIAGHYKRHYTAPNTVVSVAGRLEHADVVALCERAFSQDKWLAGTADHAPVRIPPTSKAKPYAGALLRKRDSEQTHLVLGGRAVHRFDARRFAFGLLMSAVGGGMSSRLFQEVREIRGLAYSVYSFTSMFAEVGYWGVYAGCAPAKLGEVIAVTRDVLADVAAHGITEEELVRAKGQSVGGLVLGMEDTGSRMTRLGKGEMSFGSHLELQEVIDLVEAVTLDEVKVLATELLAEPFTTVVVGPHTKAQVAKATGQPTEMLGGASSRSGRVKAS